MHIAWTILAILSGIIAIWYFSSLLIQYEDQPLILCVRIVHFIIWIVIASGVVAFMTLVKSKAKMELIVTGLFLMGFSLWYYIREGRAE
ncbi:unnamed protein product, partial [marine sediment metagenome]